METSKAQIDATSATAQFETPASLQQPLAGGDTRSDTPEVGTKQATAVSPDLDMQTKFAEETHQYIREYIRNADQKAGFFFAAMTAVLAFLHSHASTSKWLKSPIEWTFIDALAFSAMAGLAAGACMLLAVIFPRLKGSKRGILFFNAIVEHESSAEYADEVFRLTASDLVRVKLQHAYDLAKVCRAKYRILMIGFWIGGVGTVSALLYLVMARVG